MPGFVPVNEPLLNGNEKKYLNQCIDTGWISSEGPFIKEFEEKFAARVDRQHGIAVCNGSAALDIAVKALQIGAGDEVIMPSFTIISCASSVVTTGAIPVLVDSDPKTWNMNVNDIEKKITAKTKAIMVVHIYGHPVDMDPVLDIAKKHKLFVIEDAAEMHGQTYKDRKCGSFGDISVFSFYPNKHITTGEGGMVMCDDQKLADRCRALRNLCFQPPRRFVHEELGWNYRMTNLQAALGLAQLERLDEFVEKKRHIGSRYQKLLGGIKGLQLPVVETAFSKNIYWVFGIVLDQSIKLSADEVMAKLAKNGIGTRPFFWPMHEQPVFHKMGLYKNESYPVAENLGRRGFYLPSGMALTDDQMDQVVEEVRALFAE